MFVSRCEIPSVRLSYSPQMQLKHIDNLVKYFTCSASVTYIPKLGSLGSCATRTGEGWGGHFGLLMWGFSKKNYGQKM